MQKLITGVVLFLGVFFILGNTQALASGTTPNTIPGHIINPPQGVLPSIESAYATPSIDSAVLDGAVNSNGSSTTAWFETPSSGQLGSQPVANSSTFSTTLNSYNLTGLTPNTTYTFRVSASNANGTVNGNWVTFKTLKQINITPVVFSAPIITSAYATPGTNYAILNGSVNPNGSNTTAWFDLPYSTNQIGSQSMGNGSSVGVVLNPYTLTGLTPNTTYTFRISASNAGGTTNGNWVTFTTTTATPKILPPVPSVLPSIVSAYANQITATSVTLNGSVNPRGTNTNAWFQSSSTSGQLGYQSMGSGSSATTFSYNLTGLTPNTIYTFRVSANNTNGTANGNWVTFTTTTGIPKIIPTPASVLPSIVSAYTTQITTTSVTLNGAVNPRGTNTTAWFEASSASGQLGTQPMGNGSSASTLTYNLTGLTSNTTYTFRVSASNTNGTNTGNWVTFKTLKIINVIPVVNSAPTIISQIASPGTTSALLDGIINPNGASTTAWFETIGSGQLGIQNMGSGNLPVAISFNLTSLTPNATYKFRLVAQNTNGTTRGVWTTFKTISTTPPPASSPTLTLINPTTGSIGQNNISMALTGTDFVSGSVVNFSNGGITVNSTTINSTSSITVDISIANNAQTGVGSVTVTNVNGTSNAMNFRVIASPVSCLVPTISSLSPAWAYVGASSATVTINGTNFSSGTVGQYNGAARTTNFTNSGQLDIILNSSDLTSIGSGNITVTNGSNYCTSNTNTFAINSTGGGGGGGGGAIYPIISSISPSTVVANSSNLVISIYGTFSNNNVTAFFNGMARTTTYSNPGQITMNLIQSDISSTGSYNIYVKDGNGNVSNSVSFSVYSNGGGSGGGWWFGGGGGGAIYYVSVITQNATNTSNYSAVLNGSINPNNQTTTAWFEYGTSYNLATFSDTSHVYFGNFNYPSIFSQNITNLSPNTTYYFRAVANNYAGTIRGGIFSFATSGSTNVASNYTSGYSNGTNSNNTVTRTIYQNTDTNNSSGNVYPNPTTTTDTNYFDNNNLGANAIFGFTNFLPKTFLGWLVFLILILLIIIIGRKLYEDYSYQKSRNKVNANHINNLPV